MSDRKIDVSSIIAKLCEIHTYLFNHAPEKYKKTIKHLDLCILSLEDEDVK